MALRTFLLGFVVVVCFYCVCILLYFLLKKECGTLLKAYPSHVIKVETRSKRTDTSATALGNKRRATQKAEETQATSNLGIYEQNKMYIRSRTRLRPLVYAEFFDLSKSFKRSTNFSRLQAAHMQTVVAAYALAIMIKKGL